ncbi:MAG TPA: c-type cytochrome biogenesis protein CcmI [Pseudomonadales bacterium]
MNSLTLFLALLSAIAVGFVAVPLWRHRGANAASALELRREKNRDVFREREAELAQDLAQNLVTADEHARLLAELQRAFMLDMEALDRQQGGRGLWSGGRAVVLVLALAVPVAGFVMYRALGSGPDLALPELLERVGAAQTEEEQLARFGELADFLKARLERQPDDVRNGFLLGQLYMQLERFPEAIATFEGLLDHIEAGSDRATVLGQLAQSRYLQADSQITPEVQQAIDEALRMNPNEYAVMGLLAIDALMQQKLPEALAYWRRQLSSATPGSSQAQEVQRRIALVEDYLPPDAQQQDEAVSGASVTLTIDIAPELAAQVTDDMRLYVFIRDAAMPAPPIIAQQLDVPDFPLTLTLDNGDAMMAGRTLEAASQLVAGARLSRSGNPVAQSGDLQSLSEPFTLSDETATMELVINAVVP